MRKRRKKTKRVRVEPNLRHEESVEELRAMLDRVIEMGLLPREAVDLILQDLKEMEN